MMSDCGGDGNEDENDRNFDHEYRGGGDMMMVVAMVRMMGNTHLGLKDETETAPCG